MPSRSTIIFLLGILGVAVPASAEQQAQAMGKLNILGAGAVFPALLYQDALFAYQFIQPNVTWNYLETGSTKGICRIKVTHAHPFLNLPHHMPR
jgi:ABC-type phosphate transport system substrate-binding protein